MATVDFVIQALRGLESEDVKKVAAVCSELLGGSAAAPAAKRGFKSRPAITLKLIEKIQPDAKNMYGIEGEWVDIKKLPAPGTGMVIGTMLDAHGEKVYVTGAFVPHGSIESQLITAKGVVKLPGLNVLTHATFREALANVQ
jgi:hypothetical protein